jgi:hypothetical protein
VVGLAWYFWSSLFPVAELSVDVNEDLFFLFGEF